MKLKDKEKWKKARSANKDPYGSTVMRYAESWADLMEEKMALGDKLEDIAKETSHTVNTEGITGFMYGAAVSTLAAVWEYGDRLRRWHNLDWQIKNEGEKANEKGTVLNPALLNIETKGSE